MAKNLIRLYEQNTTNFANNGLTILQPISCKIKRNLQEYTYQLEMTHLLNDKGMMLVEDRIIGFKDQFFRISSIRKNLKEVNIVANHVFFDLNKNFIEDINIKDKTGSMALSQILNGTSYKHSFTATSDIDTVASSRMVRKNVVTALIGDIDNSFINRWGGELDIDGFSFKLNKQIGKDDGYTIKYGKNLTGLDLQLNMLEVVTRIRPVGFDGIEIEDLYVDSPYINNYALPIIKEIKYENVKWTGSPNYEEREDDDSYIYENLSDAQAKLVELATNEFTVNEIDLPQTTINIEFIELSKTEEYEHLKFLQNINIGDTVHVYHKALDINLKSRCIEYVYDCILNKYETITLGSYTKNFFSKTENTNNKVDNSDLDIEYSGMVNDILQQTQDHLNNAITQAMGGYVYKTNNALYIMDTDDISTAQKIWVWNKNGLAFSSNGVNGPYTTGITMDGYIVGSMISANSIVGEQIQANSIKAANLEIDVQKKITSATDEETVRTLINAGLDGLELSVSRTYATQTSVDSSISGLETRVNTAEQKITDSAIISTVTSSTTYKNDLSGKVDSNKIVSTINQTAEAIKIQASKIELTGEVVANAINSGSTSINGDKITSGKLVSNNKNMEFDLNQGRLNLLENGKVMATALQMKENKSQKNGLGLLANNNSFVALGLGDNDDNTIYKPYIALANKITGTDWHSGINILKTIHAYFNEFKNMHIIWDGFKRASRDKISMYTTNNSTSDSKLIMLLEDDYKTAFEIQHKMYNKSFADKVVSFRGTGGSENDSGNQAGINFYQNANFNNWRIWGVQSIQAQSFIKVANEISAAFFSTETEAEKIQTEFHSPCSYDPNIELFGTGVLDDGYCKIDFPKGFCHRGYFVLITPQSQGNYYINKYDEYFEVIGDISSFDYLVKANL